jgi:anti-anti-sigma factor
MSEYRMVDVAVAPPAVVAQITEPILSTAIAADILESELRQIMAEHRPSVLVLDFSQVKMISSSSVGKLLLIQKQLQAQRGQLRLACVAVPIADACRALGLSDRLLFIFDSVETALHARVVGTNEEREVMED